MNAESLTELLVEELQDLYDAEQQLLKALPKMAEAAFDEELREAFEQHADETQGQVERLEEAFRELNTSPGGKHCPAMEGLIEEAEELISAKGEGDPNVLDAGLIVAAQKVEHYEMAGYGSARTFARTLGAERVAELLQETLEEEGATDKRLTQLAETSINLDAAEAEEDAAEEEREDAKAKNPRTP